MTKVIQKQNDLLWVILFSFLVACIHSYFALSHLESKIALQSFSLMDYANHILNPENFTRDWANGIRDLSLSLPIVVVTLLHHFSNINLPFLLRCSAFLQVFIGCIAIGSLCLTLHHSRVVSILFITLCLISPLTFVNMARFGYEVGGLFRHDLQWGFSFAFVLFAISFFIQEKYYQFSFFIVLSVYCHLTIAFWGMLFLSGHIFLHPTKYIYKKKFLIPNVWGAIGLLPYLFTLWKYNIGLNGFPNEYWLKTLHWFSFHHFPISMNSFGDRAHKEFLPVLSLLIMFCICSFDNKNKNSHRIISSGVAVCAAVTVIYFCFSEIWPIISIVKLQFHRISYFISFFSTLSIIYMLIQKSQKKIIVGWVCFFMIILMLLSKTTIPLIPMFILALFLTDHKLLYKLLVFSAYGILLGTYHVIYKIPLLDFIYRGSLVRLFFVFILSIVFVIFFFCNRARNNADFALSLCIFFLCGVLFFHNYEKEQTWVRSKFAVGDSYVSAQKWASINTSGNSLFLVDPSWGYGWRDFSNRSKYGSLREWLYTPITQSQSFDLFIEGARRAKLFGVDYIKLLNEEDINAIHFGRQLQNRVRTIFYSMSGNELYNLCKQSDIDYIVMRKKFVSVNHLTSLKNFAEIIFENEHFYVLALFS